jgi:group I intron endonuclease
VGLLWAKRQKMNAGVYMIECERNGAYYIGSSVNLRSRISNHKNKLATGKHRNKRLQRTADKYGVDSLDFRILEYCDTEDTIKLEQHYLDMHINCDNCINFCKSAQAPMLGQKFSNEHAQKIAESQQRNTYEFYFKDGSVKSYKSLRLAASDFNVKPSIVSKWFKRKNLGKKHGFLCKFGVITAKKTGDEELTLLPYEYKIEPWQIAGASSKSQYYRTLRKQLP